MTIEFTAHNIRLDNGEYTKPGMRLKMEQHPWLLAAKRTLDVVFPRDRQQLRLADLGCLEGGYAVEFARMGFQVLGLDIRESNLAACRYVQSHTNLPNLEFVQDDAWNIASYGTFDAVFCCGLFYHLDRPKRFLDLMSTVTRKLLILQTHFATAEANPKFGLSELTDNEGLQGRWYTEFGSDEAFHARENARWASWDNYRSFWLKREYLLQGLQTAGFDLVAEQFDGLGTNIAADMQTGFYKTDDRGTFIGVKTKPV